jgi:hypothetical protein
METLAALFVLPWVAWLWLRWRGEDEVVGSVLRPLNDDVVNVQPKGGWQNAR